MKMKSAKTFMRLWGKFEHTGYLMVSIINNHLNVLRVFVILYKVSVSFGDTY